MVLLTLKTTPNEKIIKLRLDHTVLKIVAGFHGLHGSFFGKVLANTNRNFSNTLGFFRSGKKKRKKKEEEAEEEEGKSKNEEINCHSRQPSLCEPKHVTNLPDD